MTCPDGCCPKNVLDLFCGAGGAAMGLHRAWPHAHIVGVDIKPQKHYPFEFILGDAMTHPLDGYDFVWASPPCQGYSTMTALKGGKHPLLISRTKRRLGEWGLRNGDWVLENVPGAIDSFTLGWMLCGTMFGLQVARHRYFDANWFWFAPTHQPHPDGLVTVLTKSARLASGNLRGPSSHDRGKRAMGIDWMTQYELGESIPPAYSEYIARQWACSEAREVANAMAFRVR